MRAGGPVFVDTGAWIALALTHDPLHARAREAWEMLLGAGARLHTSVPVVLEAVVRGPRIAGRTRENLHFAQQSTTEKPRPSESGLLLRSGGPCAARQWQHRRRPRSVNVSHPQSLRRVAETAYS